MISAQSKNRFHATIFPMTNSEDQNSVINTTPTSVEEDQKMEKELQQMRLKDGYWGLLGAIVGTLISELILYIGKVDGDPPRIFLAIGLVFAFRQVFQIRIAQRQLKELENRPEA